MLLYHILSKESCSQLFYIKADFSAWRQFIQSIISHSRWIDLQQLIAQEGFLKSGILILKVPCLSYFLFDGFFCWFFCLGICSLFVLPTANYRYITSLPAAVTGGCTLICKFISLICKFITVCKSCDHLPSWV